MSEHLPYLLLDRDGPQFTREGDAGDLLSTAWAAPTDTLAVPVERLGDDFFRLSTGVLGVIAQKFQNYQVRLAIVGDISSRTEASAPLRDFMRETNGRDAFWFVDDEAELRRRLGLGAAA